METMEISEQEDVMWKPSHCGVRFSESTSQEDSASDYTQYHQYTQRMPQKKRPQAAFRTEVIDKKIRPRRMQTIEQVDPSILKQGKVVSYVSNESGYGSEFDHLVKGHHPEGQADQYKPLKQGTLQFTAGEPNKVVKSAAHKEISKKISGSVLNPNSPTFVSLLSPQQNLTDGSWVTKTPQDAGYGYGTTSADRTYGKNPVSEQANGHDVSSMSNRSVHYGDKKHSPVPIPILTSDAFKNMKTQDYNATKAIGHGNVPNHRNPSTLVPYGNEYRPRSQKSQPSPPNPGVVAVRNNDHVNFQNGSQKLIGYLKHPLYSHWSFWYYRNEKNKTWTENQIQIGSIGSVEAFWSSYQTLELPSSLRFGCDYAFFRNNIAPMWEDEGNKEGGRWIYTMDKNPRPHELDTLWEELLFALLGHGFGQFHDEICGAVINLREKGDKLALWTANADKADVQMAIGRVFQSLLQANLKEYGTARAPIKYEVHSDNNRRRGATPRVRYEL